MPEVPKARRPLRIPRVLHEARTLPIPSVERASGDPDWCGSYRHRPSCMLRGDSDSAKKAATAAHLRTAVMPPQGCLDVRRITPQSPWETEIEMAARKERAYVHAGGGAHTPGWQRFGSWRGSGQLVKLNKNTAR
ncbi:hypothetical protein H4582DRAFT_2053768 [Lactarius indigo]|nr:hypothetical protein H4582DRAFT_2053768 [Lactarius indigo]